MVPRWEQSNIEPISGLNHYINRHIFTMQYYRMGPVKYSTNKQIEPLSGDQLRGLDCTSKKSLNPGHNSRNYNQDAGGGPQPAHFIDVPSTRFPSCAEQGLDNSFSIEIYDAF